MLSEQALIFWDALKAKLEALGLELSVSKVGVQAKVPADFDASKLEGLR